MLKIYIRDNSTGTVHEYGTNPHDSLEVQEDGSLHYLNLQGCVGTQFPEEGYTFCYPDGTDPRESKDIDIRNEPYIDIGGEYYNDKKVQREQKRLMRKLKKIIRKEENKKC